MTASKTSSRRSSVRTRLPIRMRRTRGVYRSLLATSLCLALVACQDLDQKQPPLGAQKPDTKLDTFGPVGPSVPEDPGLAGDGKGQAYRKPDPGEPAQVAGGQSLDQPEFYSGSGRLTGAGPRGAEAAISNTGRVSLNFVNTDVREVVDVVLGDTLQVNYIIDPSVQGLITVRTSQPLPRSDVIPVLSDILGLNDAIISLEDGIYRVIPRDAGNQRLSTPVLSSSIRNFAQGYGVHILPVEFASAEELMKVLEPFVTPGALRPDRARNLLLYAGTAAQARDLEEMVGIFDVDWMAGMSFALLPAKVAQVDQLTSELETVFAQDADGPLTGVVRFLPIERMNAVLVITQQPKYLERARLWVERLDRGGEVSGRQLFVYYVKNARAADLAETLGEVFGDSARSDLAAVEGQLAPGLVPAEIRSGAFEESLLERHARNPAQQADIEASEGPIPAAELGRPGGLPVATPAERAVAGEGLAIGTLREDSDIRIIADEHNNALLVLATQAEYTMIEATLDRLDLVPLQVLIEATIAEVTLNDLLRYGLNWAFQQGDLTTTFSTVASGAVESAFPGFSLLLDGSDGQVVLNALTEVTDVDVISSPSIVVLDNQSARLQVGDEVPVSTQSAVSVTDPDSPVVNSIELVDTGVVLEVTPRVNPGGLVTLDIVQEVSTPVPTTSSGIDSPTIQQRRVESTVVVQSGETVALGGLIQDTESEAISGVPLLSSIPVLGHLFKTTTEEVRRTELLVLITPRVIRSALEAREVTEELRRRLSTVTPLENKIRRTVEPRKVFGGSSSEE
ncbi:MAG: type II secretion system secretin GspD [Pseudomonadota bacterium]